jgi:hypothetical protein
MQSVPETLPLDKQDTLEFDPDLDWLNGNSVSSSSRPVKRDVTEPAARVTVGDQAIPLTTFSSSSSMRRRNNTSADMVSRSGGSPQNNQFLEALYDSILSWYPGMKLRTKDQLYFNMIRSVLILQETWSTQPSKSSSLTQILTGTSQQTTTRNQPIYWIQNDHLYTQILNVQNDPSKILAKFETGPQVGFLAVAAETMDMTVDFVWQHMVNAGKVSHYALHPPGEDEIL